MMISLYKYLMGLIKLCSNKDKIFIRSNTFNYEYDNIYELLDRFHLMPEVKEFYKDFKVRDARINYIDEFGNHHRNIYISVVL